MQARAPLDEFDTLGLGRHRETDGWLTESSAPPVPTVAEETPRRKPQERVLGIVVTLLLLVITVGHAWCALILLIAADMNKNDGYVVLAIAGMFPALALFRRIFLARWSPVDLIVLLIGVSAAVFLIIWSSLHLGGPLPVTVLLVYAAATAGTAYLVRQSHVAGRHRGNPYPGR
ncbi:MAG: hypothetical protein EOP85_03185 [Verrucomicrobiaceae bacterium]|nr:MAG: hypothetical protein EOP85_03185 [Verrucomicrobiaceae bacterium]